MSLTNGTQLGPYEILSPLGAGGMGEVYRARDTKLNRDVALKVLPEAFAANAERMARFEREAQVLASLNHPNIASIYGLEESTAVRALVMELVEGETLAARLVGPGLAPASPHEAKRPTRGSALQLEEALSIAKEIAEALEYAHERGIIHRDLKPANIKVTPEAAVKVLDFGLAKAIEAENSASDISKSPTISIAATQAGMVLGTAAYMSPEQARGKTVDRRADIWAFGCVLFEMLTGKQAFEGETTSDVLAAVIRAEPNWNDLPPNTPASIRKLVQRCLQKDPKQRLQAIGEARIAIEETQRGDVGEGSALPLGSVLPREPKGLPYRALPWALAGLLAGALISGFMVWKFVARGRTSTAMRFRAVTNFAGVQAQPALSPDGRSVAFVSNRDGPYNIYVGLISGGSLVQITNDSNLKARPAWSPDGTTIVYSRLNHSGIWDIWEVPALGGTPRRLILNALDPAWSPDGNSLAYENMADGTLWISGVSGENARQVVLLQGSWHGDTEPRFSPDGRELAFSIRSAGPFGELDVADLTSGKVRQLTRDTALVLSPAWSADGRFIYFASSRGGTMNIWKIAAAGGSPEQITSGQGDDAELDVSSDGKRIVFSTWRAHMNIAQLDLAAKPGQESVKLLTSDLAREQYAPVYSPDAKYLAYFSNLKGVEREGIWVANADGSNPVRLVEDSRINILPRWTWDSQRLNYFSRRAGGGNEYRSVLVSGGAPQTILKVALDTSRVDPEKAAQEGINWADPYFDVGPDGRLLFRGPKDQVQSFDPRDNKGETLVTLPASERWGLVRWSPDGRSITYIVDSSREGDPDAGLWVNDFKHPPRQIFRGWVLWYARGPGNEIYLLEGKPDLNGALWKVGWDGQGPTRLPTAIPLSNSYWVKLGRNSQDSFDVSPDRRHAAFTTEEVLQANIGMIENVR